MVQPARCARLLFEPAKRVRVVHRVPKELDPPPVDRASDRARPRPGPSLRGRALPGSRSAAAARCVGPRASSAGRIRPPHPPRHRAPRPRSSQPRPAVLDGMECANTPTRRVMVVARETDSAALFARFGPLAFRSGSRASRARVSAAQQSNRRGEVTFSEVIRRCIRSKAESHKQFRHGLKSGHHGQTSALLTYRVTCRGVCDSGGIGKTPREARTQGGAIKLRFDSNGAGQ